MEKVERRVHWFEDDVKVASEMGEAYATTLLNRTGDLN